MKKIVVTDYVATHNKPLVPFMANKPGIVLTVLHLVWYKIIYLVNLSLTKNKAYAKQWNFNFMKTD